MGWEGEEPGWGKQESNCQQRRHRVLGLRAVGPAKEHKVVDEMVEVVELLAPLVAGRQRGSREVTSWEMDDG